MNSADRNRMYDTLAAVAKEFPEANLHLVAVGLGAATAVMYGGVLNIKLYDGSGFAFIREDSGS